MWRLREAVLGFKVVWLSTVLGAANGAWWLGLAALLGFAGVQMFFSPSPRRELRVLATGLAMGVVLETVVHKAGWIAYAPGWPHPVLPAGVDTGLVGVLLADER